MQEVASKLEESENLLDRERSVLRGLVAENESLMVHMGVSDLFILFWLSWGAAVIIVSCYVLYVRTYSICIY